MNHPVLVVADPDVLKEVLLKQFNSFMDRSVSNLHFPIFFGT